MMFKALRNFYLTTPWKIENWGSQEFIKEGQIFEIPDNWVVAQKTLKVRALAIEKESPRGCPEGHKEVNER